MDQSQQIIGEHPRLRKALERADRVAPTALPVFIHGESGTGKELIARRIHEKSGRKGKLVVVNCPEIAKDLLESELFGHEKGAFTGAVQSKPGAFEQAHNGTLFLDEIGDLALEHQAKVLRAIQEGEVRRVGGTESRHVDVRIVTATHRNLAQHAAEKTFREDLYFRLVVYRLELPPLRERREDIPALAEAFLGPGQTLGRGALAMLVRHDWPGNIRELKNAIEAAAVDSLDGCISPAVLRDVLEARGPQAPNSPPAESLQDLLARGRVTAMDLQAGLGISRSTAGRKLKDLVARQAVTREGVGRGTCYRVAGKQCPRVPARAQAALGLAQRSGRLTRSDYEREAEVPARTAKRDLAALVASGVLEKVGAGRGAWYRLRAAGAENKPNATAG